MLFYEQQPEVSYQCGYCQRDLTVPVHWRWLQEGQGAAAAVCSNCRRASVFNLGGRGGAVRRADGASDYVREVTHQEPTPRLVEYPPDVVPEPIARRHRDVQRAMQRELWSRR